MRALPGDGSSALCLLNEWSAGVDERLIDSVRRIDGLDALQIAFAHRYQSHLLVSALLNAGSVTL
ncbi:MULTISPECIES: hypothetical protein [Neorhizobium]|jgi:hypothetical protein|uniref:hypothetical protein n=1 Tax=Neorhizobium sp. T6_25 TaxID=2093833 RepID=UPI000CFA493B|nr:MULTISPECIES: hypothetical protein [Neorhizobium]